jgi:hypothetical protein
MALTTAQLQTLKAAIAAETDAAFVALRNSGATGAMAEWYNEPKSPDLLAWRDNVQPAESDDAPDYSTFDAISAGKRESWGFFLAYPRDFTRNKTRKWITDVWGNATAASNAEAILLTGTRKANRVEAVFGGTSRTTGTVTATNLNFVGTLRNEDIVLALGS